MPPLVPRLSSSSLYAIRPPKTLGFLPYTPFNVRTLPRRPLLPLRPLRLASQGGPQRPQYVRFQNIENFRYLWKTSPNFRYGVSTVCLGVGGIYYYNREEVAITGRRRFNVFSPAREAAQAQSTYRMVMQEYGRQILPPSHPYSQMVNRVLTRLIPAAGLQKENWEVKVIDDEDQMNAFVLPGNKVFVFSGIIPICGNEDGLAAVLGHEIAHNIAHHSAEKLSQVIYIPALALLLSLTFDISGETSSWLLSLALGLPFSRKMESEADYIGLLMMAQACYDPSAAVGFWQRMAREESGGPPQIMSTHPASRKRMEVISGWLPEAQQKRAAQQCGMTSDYMDDFTRAFAGSVGHEDEGFW